MHSRIQLNRPNYYSNRILIGPWLDDRLNSEWTPPKIREISTTYQTCYVEQLPAKIDSSFVWDLKLKSEDSNFIPQTKNNDISNYFENFSSTYDLSYNHFPKCFSSYIPRRLRFRLERHEPIDDYIPSFGNITKFGLVDYKKQQWQCDAQDPRKTYTTHHNDTFMAPKLEEYRFKRYAIPAKNSSKINKTNLATVPLNLRSQTYFNITPTNELVKVCKEPTTNPINWKTQSYETNNKI